MSGKGTVIWILPLDDAVPPSPDGWNVVVRQPNNLLPLDPRNICTPVVVVHHATVNSALGYDPVLLAREVAAKISSPPKAVVGIIVPLIELHVDTQHAIAHEVATVLGATRSYTVASAIGMTGEGKRKIAESENRPDFDPSERAPAPSHTAAQMALEVATAARPGDPVSGTASEFVYAYTTANRRRTPFRCTPLQRQILRELAKGDLIATTSAIADRVGYPKGKVSEAITELVNHLMPREAGVADSRDGHQRLGLVVHRFGAWIRLVESRPPVDAGATGGL